MKDVTGFTLIEILAASILAAMVAGGTMSAFVTASRILQAKNAVGSAEASGYAQQTIEQLRNFIACDSPWFTNDAACTPSAALPTAWQADPLPAAEAGTRSILATTAKRCYRVLPQNCDQPNGIEASGSGNCFAVQVRVCWNGSACPC